MSALYQRARPVRFDEVVGQEHVKSVLLAGLRSSRTGHAYLFSGPRGVGKTTTARLLAMAVNCEHPDSGQRPCGVCESCRLVQSGSHPDVIELDAASNNSVDDIRDMREKVHLASLRGGVRVWILDEAHMLSKAAANALLKTLEEPPPGLLFVLATTEPEKLPATVLSRCQHFRFRRLSDDEIVGKLAALCVAAGVEAVPDALELVAHAADGGMRDAESMLERLLVVDGPITFQAAEDALGLPPRDRLQALASAVTTGDVGQALDTAAGLYRDGFSPRTLAEQFGRCLRDALFEHVRDGNGFRLPLDEAGLMRLIHTLDDDLDRFIRHGDLYALEVWLIKGINAVTDNIPTAQWATVAVAATEQPGGSITDAATRSSAGPKTDAATRTNPNPNTDAATRTHPSPNTDAATRTHPSANAGPQADGARTSSKGSPAGPPTGSGKGEPPPAFDPQRQATAQAIGTAPDTELRPLSWHTIKTHAGPQLKAFLKPAQETIEDNVVTLRYGPTAKFHYDQLLTRGPELASLIENLAGPGYTVLAQGPDGGAPKKL